MKRLRTAGIPVAALLLVLICPGALRAGEGISQEQAVLMGLARTVSRASGEALPRTVCIRIHLGEKTGFGSGALVSSEGHILTCAHVSEPGEKMTVLLHDGRILPARRLGKNSKNDYAMIKIDGGPFPYFRLGSSAGVREGDWVVALGHPGGPYADSKSAVAVGRVTGLHRKLPVQFNVKYYDDAIQTDAPIFAGNSGGPLINLAGELIGINGAILLVNDNAYATPIDEIKADLEALKGGVELPGRAPKDMGKVMRELTSEIDPEDLQKMYGKTPMGRILGPLMKMLGGGGGGGAEAAQARRERKRRFGREAGLEQSFGPLARALAKSVVEILVSDKHVGYGVVVSNGGEVLTNDRILGAGPVSVRVGTRVRRARVLGREGMLDVALLRFPAEGLGLEGAAFGRSADLALGEWVITPGPEGQILAVGAVSAKNRKIGRNRKIPTMGLMGMFGKPNESPLREYPRIVQHDSRIVKGMFGAPLFDARGFLVGVNVANFYRGSSYATPMDAIEPLMEKLRAGLSVEPPPFLEAPAPESPFGGFGEGSDFSGVFEQLRKMLGGKGGGGDWGKLLEPFRKFFEPPEPWTGPKAYLGIEPAESAGDGVTVGRVFENSGASRGGIKEGDRIIRFRGGTVRDVESLQRFLGARKPGDKVVLTVLRDGKRVKLEIVLGAKPDDK